MKKILSIAIISVVTLSAYAVPAMPGWQVRTLPDGSTIEVEQRGDEYDHYFVNRAGQELRLLDDGSFEVVGTAPTEEQARARRAAAKARRAPLATKASFGYSPYLPPKGVVIMVNFKDTKFKTTTTKDVIDNMCNSENCTVNRWNGVNYGSIGQYFRDQSDGQYNLQLDVYGPVTLANNASYYGGNGDQYAANAVIEACKLADGEIDFKQYDWNSDGKVDFVYILYAGLGEAMDGGSNTIWPHSYNISSARYWGQCTYSETDCKFDGKAVDSYAMSNEYAYGAIAGIGVICHEYSHVIGLPDHYDTAANEGATVNSSNYLTPNNWDVMDAGSYNGNAHCPPNYNAWERAFCGWYNIANPGTTPQKLEMKAIGTTGYSAYQINSSGRKQSVTTAGLNYYIENRQQQGWDTYIPGHGMLIWKVDYNQSIWASDAPNNTDNNPRFTVVSAYGTQIGNSNNGPNNPFPGNKNVTSWSGLSGKPLLDITESKGVINLIYIKNPTYNVTWMVNGEELEVDEYNLNGTQSLHLPTNEVIPCDGTEFIGWTKESEWLDPFAEPADLFVTPSGKVKADATYHALFR